MFLFCWLNCNQFFFFSLVAQRLKRLPPMRETWVRSLRWEDPLEKKEMVTHSSTLAWRIPWMEKPGRLQSIGSQRVGHDWATSPSLQVWILGALDFLSWPMTLRVFVERELPVDPFLISFQSAFVTLSHKLSILCSNQHVYKLYVRWP